MWRASVPDVQAERALSHFSWCIRCNERAERTGREGGEKKRRLRNSLPPPPIPQLGFYGRENAHRGSTDEWNFNEIFASAIGYLGERGRRSLSLCLSLSFSFSSLSKRFTERALIPSAGCIRSSSMNRGRGKQVMGGVCSTQFSPMQITSVYYFARKKGEEEGRQRLRRSGK